MQGISGNFLKTPLRNKALKTFLQLWAQGQKAQGQKDIHIEDRPAQALFALAGSGNYRPQRAVEDEGRDGQGLDKLSEVDRPQAQEPHVEFGR